MRNSDDADARPFRSWAANDASDTAQRVLGDRGGEGARGVAGVRQSAGRSRRTTSSGGR